MVRDFWTPQQHSPSSKTSSTTSTPLSPKITCQDDLAGVAYRVQEYSAENFQLQLKKKKSQHQKKNKIMISLCCGIIDTATHDPHGPPHAALGKCRTVLNFIRHHFSVCTDRKRAACEQGACDSAQPQSSISSCAIPGRTQCPAEEQELSWSWALDSQTTSPEQGTDILYP